MKRLFTLFIVVLASVLSFSSCDTQGSSQKDDDEPIPTEGIVYQLSSDASYASVVGYNGTKLSDIVIASTYENVPVTDIADKAFMLKDISSIVIPDSITKIGDYAFDRCTNLVKITFGKNVTNIGNYAFVDCNYLTTITLPSTVTTIGNGAFDGCYNLKSINIPDGVSKISFGTFQYCPSLTNIDLPESVKTIGMNAFNRCNYTTYKSGKYFSANGNPYGILNSVYSDNPLNTYEIHQDTRFIQGGAFRHQESLTEITIPDNVISIGNDAFRYCSELTKIVIGKNIEIIDTSAFSDCENLRNVYYRGTAAEWDKITIDQFNDDLSEAKLYFYSESAPVQSGNFWHYNENGDIIIW